MGDFGFGFDDSAFSDRVVHIEIIPEEALDLKSDREGFAHSTCKRKQGDQNLNKEDGGASDSSTGVKGKTLHLNSLLLAEKSPFFYKLFKNGMKESQQKHVTLRIDESEEAALMDLLMFMYNNTLSATAARDLLNVLLVADKFEVISCVRCCIELLQKLPISLEFALLYLELPLSVLIAEPVQPLKDAAKQYLIEQGITKSQKEMMDFPLSAVEVLLSSDGLLVAKEDKIFDFILKWARKHYPKREERQEIVTKRLAQFISFPNLSYSKLKEVLICPDFNSEEVSKLVLEALFFKAEVPYGRHIHASSDQPTTKCGSSRRVYQLQPIKVVQFEHPWPRCVVYFDLTKEDCASLFPSRTLFFQPFYLGGNRFKLFAKCTRGQPSSSYHFGLFLRMKKSSGSCTFDYEFAAMETQCNAFVSQLKCCNCESTGIVSGKGIGNLFKTSWTNFIGEDSKYFFDGILHLRAELTLHNSQA